MTAILRTVAKKLEGSEAVKTMGSEKLTWSVCRYLSNFQPSIMSLATAATLATTLTALAALPHSQDLTPSVGQYNIYCNYVATLIPTLPSFSLTHYCTH